jgi:branched-chain amino acid transport system permease protein
MSDQLDGAGGVATDAGSGGTRIEGAAAPPTTGVSPPRAYLPIAITVALLALVPVRYADSRTGMGVATDGLVFAAYAVAFNVIFGSTGQLFLCMGALAGIGGYTSALLSDRAGLPMVPSMVLATVAASLVGGLLSWVAVRRSLDVIFTGVVTLAFSLAFDNLLLGQRELTGGETGLVVEAGADTFLGELVPPYYVFLLLLAGFLVLYRLLQRSHVGWAFRALRDDELAAELTGVDVTRHRVFAGLLGSAMLGLTGALVAHTEGFISPSTFAFGNVDVRVLVMLVFGGIGTLLGPVVGAVAFTILDEWVRVFSEFRLVVYGIAIIVLFLGFRRGVVPAVRSLYDRVVAGRRRGRRRES